MITALSPTGTKTTVNEDGVEKDAYTVVFTNGALKELEELKESIEAPDLDSVLKIAIGLTKRFENIRHEREHRDETSS